MPTAARYLSDLAALFRAKPVALLGDLRQALRTQSRTTVFRALSAAGYRTSYSHAGRYYTLDRIPKFDSRGIWIHRGIGFSARGTLRAAVTDLVETSAAGQTHGELQDVLKLRAHDTLRLLVRARKLTRRRFEQTYVYLSSKTERASAQWARRLQMAAAAVPAELEPSRTIEVLLELIRHPSGDAGAVSGRLRAAGHMVSPAQAEAILDRYELKKTPRSRSPRWKR